MWKRTNQRPRNNVLKKYDGLSLYDIYMKKRYTIDDEDTWYVNKYGYALIGKPDHPYGTPTDHAYFLIHDDLFDRILATEQNTDIALKVTPKDVLFSSINESSKY